MKLELIQALVRAGEYHARKHFLTRAFERGFTVPQAREAVLNGTILEDYPDRGRCLIVGATTSDGQTVVLHVVVRYVGTDRIVFWTGYFPDATYWETPYRRRPGAGTAPEEQE